MSPENQHSHRLRVRENLYSQLILSRKLLNDAHAWSGILVLEIATLSYAFLTPNSFADAVSFPLLAHRKPIQSALAFFSNSYKVNATHSRSTQKFCPASRCLIVRRSSVTPLFVSFYIGDPAFALGAL